MRAVACSFGVLVFMSSFSSACKSQAPAKAPSPSSPPAQPAQAASQPSTPASMPAGTAAAAEDDATQLATKVYLAAGGADLGQVAELKFRFVVYDGETKRADIEHRWDLKGGRDRVIWSDKSGARRDAIVDLGTKQAEGLVDGKAPDAAGKEDLSKKAYGRWVNDSYWLMMPLKLLDRGVTRAKEAPREHGGKKYEIVKLSFGQVGLTPADQYWLFIDPAAARIERWEMKLEGDKSGKPPSGGSWADYRAVGPLHLAMDHKNDDGKIRIALEGVAALDQVEKADFELPAPATKP